MQYESVIKGWGQGKPCCTIRERMERDNMELLKNFPIKDIKISEDFQRTPPGTQKMERAERQYMQTGTLPTNIIINAENVLIDGYITYLTARKHGIEYLDVYQGFYETIVAVHGKREKNFVWRVPLYLSGQIEAGDKVLVTTARGVRRVRVVELKMQQYPEQGRRLRRVLRIDR